MTPAPETSAMPTLVFDLQAAMAEVLRHAVGLRRDRKFQTVEQVALLDSPGRVLARPILADRDQPPFDRATRDGFAVRANEFSSDVSLHVAGQIRAGELWLGPPLATGEAIEIMTGAPAPSGADAVAMIEHTEPGALRGTIQARAGRSLRPGENIVPQGSEARQGAEVVAAGSLISAAEIALAASSGLDTLAVYAKPSVAIVATGDELVELHQTPDARQIRNSNSYALAALVASAGAIPRRLPIARDLRDDLAQRATEARQHDLILFSGGVSMGKFDLVEQVLAEFDAEFFFTGVKMQPGKPVVFGRLPQRNAAPARYFFGLPGNPISTQVTFHCFVEPFLRTLLGDISPGPRFAQAALTHDVDINPALTRLLPARLTPDITQPSVSLIGWRGSGDLAANARANCYAVLPPERSHFHSGDIISVMLR